MKQPNVTQKIIIKDQENRTMILRHTDGNYDFPGGQLEWGEDLFASLQRELREELDFELDHQPRLFHVWNFVNKKRARHSIMVYYIYQSAEMLKLKSPEGMEVLWLRKEEMSEAIEDSDYVDRIFNWQDTSAPHSLFYCD